MTALNRGIDSNCSITPLLGKTAGCKLYKALLTMHKQHLPSEVRAATWLVPISHRITLLGHLGHQIWMVQAPRGTDHPTAVLPEPCGGWAPANEQSGSILQPHPHPPAPTCTLASCSSAQDRVIEQPWCCPWPSSPAAGSGCCQHLKAQLRGAGRSAGGAWDAQPRSAGALGEAGMCWVLSLQLEASPACSPALRGPTLPAVPIPVAAAGLCACSAHQHKHFQLLVTATQLSWGGARSCYF